MTDGRQGPGSNTQRWRFLVVKDPEIKKKVQVYYKRLYDETVGPRYSSSAPPPGSDPARYQRQHAAVKYLTDHYHEAPVWIVACLEDGENPDRTAGSSIYPAVQNMLLATRALGLGTTLTTRHTGYGKEVDAIFGLPSGGWPRGRFGPLGAGRSRMSSFKISGANLIAGFNHTEGCPFSGSGGTDSSNPASSAGESRWGVVARPGRGRRGLKN